MSHSEREALAADFITANSGSPTATVVEAATLTRKSVSTIRNASYRGELTGARGAPNGPVRITCRELARWFVGGQRFSLPIPKADRESG